MFPKGGLAMNRDRLLISSAMLTSLNEANKTDNLNLLEPFVQVCIASTTPVNTMINKAIILEKLKQEFALSDMPSAVLDKILIRLSKRSASQRIVEYKNKEFRFVQNPKSDVEAFSRMEKDANEQIEYILKELSAWLTQHLSRLHFTKDDLIKYLSEFFESKGLDILFEFDSIRSCTTTNSDKVNYQIGRFIINAKDTNDFLFQRILSVVQGMMIASAIYIDVKPASKFIERRGLNGIDVFIDTTLAIYAMGYKTKEQEEAAVYLIKALNNGGANLYIFPQHLGEIKDILFAFCNRHPSKSNYQTLERLELDSWSTAEIKTEIEFLETRLKSKLNLDVYKGNQYTTSNRNLLYNADRAYIDSEQLKTSIRNKIAGYRKNDAKLQNDIDAVSSIIVKRDGLRFSRLETCLALFVTTNYSLVRECNQFLGYQMYKQDIPPIISDVDLTTIVWLRYGYANPDIPRLLLVRHAAAAVNASDAVLENFFKILQNLEKRGGITAEEAAYMRYDIYTRAEIMQICDGEPENVTEVNVRTILESLKTQYTRSAEAETAKVRTELAAERDKLSRLQEEHFMEIEKISDDMYLAQSLAFEQQKESQRLQQINQAARESLLKTAEGKATEEARNWSNVFYAIILFAVAIIFLVCIYATVASMQSNFGQGVSNYWVAYILDAISLLSVIVLLIPTFKLPQKIRTKFQNLMFDKLYPKEYTKIEPQLNILRGEHIDSRN